MAKHTVQIPEHVARRNAHDPKSFTPEHRITRRIAPRLVPERVAFTVNLDDQALLKAGEIDRHFANRELLPELQSSRSLSKLLP
jgi:hypothetical protein